MLDFFFFKKKFDLNSNMIVVVRSESHQSSTNQVSNLAHLKTKTVNNQESKSMNFRFWLWPVFAEARLRNVLWLGAFFFLLFSAFNTLQTFESTVNESRGVAALGVLYASFTLCNIGAPAVVAVLGARRALAAGAAAYVVFLLANLKPVEFVDIHIYHSVYRAHPHKNENKRFSH